MVWVPPGEFSMGDSADTASTICQETCACGPVTGTGRTSMLGRLELPKWPGIRAARPRRRTSSRRSPACQSVSNAEPRFFARTNIARATLLDPGGRALRTREVRMLASGAYATQTGLKVNRHHIEIPHWLSPYLCLPPVLAGSAGGKDANRSSHVDTAGEIRGR